MAYRPAVLAAVLVIALLPPAAHAQGLEVAPFAGIGYGGSLLVPGSGREVALESGVLYGATVSLPISTSWRFEALWSRQESRVESAVPPAHLAVAVERYLAGFQEEVPWGSTRAFGTALIGATRIAPAGYDSDTWFTLALGLGIKIPVTKHAALRLEGRGFYTPVTGGGATFCSGGSCVFAYSGSGLFQGDVSAGLAILF